MLGIVFNSLWVAWSVVDLVKLVHMSFQRRIGVIRFEADRAPHSLSHWSSSTFELTVMISNVVLKIGQLSESPFAIRYTAFKRTDTSMNPQMGVQVRLLLECCKQNGKMWNDNFGALMSVFFLNCFDMIYFDLCYMSIIWFDVYHIMWFDLLILSLFSYWIHSF